MRNPDCPKYDACLSRAAKKNAPGWDCSGCVHKTAYVDREEIDITAYLHLLRAIFWPDEHAAYRGTRTVRRSGKAQEMQTLASA